MISTVMLIRVARNCAFMRARRGLGLTSSIMRPGSVSRSVTGGIGVEEGRQELFARGRMEAHV